MASSIIDNQADNTLLDGLKRLSADGHELSIATAFFSLNALLLLADTLTGYQRIRILFGDDADAQQRRKLLEMLRLRSDAELLKQRETHPQLAPLRAIEHLFTEGRIEARCYTTKKFHAKAYLVHRPHIYPNHLGVIGSGNFTFPGLLQNIELNVELTKEQLGELALWYEARWEEAAPDVVTEDLLREIRRQITLYDPFVLYAKALALWGERQQDLSALQRTRLVDQLDPHQWYGFSQALKIIAREHGVMVCDGVGLGKSFVALALMEHFCRQGQNVLLIAPKSVYETSWRTYLDNYLWEYREPFNTVKFLPMTALGFDPQAQDDDPEGLRRKREEVQRLYHQAHVVVIDESHNFRTTSADRYTNLYDVIGPFQGRPKATILLTATPINTAYRDLSAQMALITHDRGSLGGYRIDQIKRLAADLDRDAHARSHVPQLQMQLSLAETSRDDLEQVLESVVIQRSRKTCKQLSEAIGKPLRFPSRRAPVCVEYTIGPQSERYRDLITLAHKRFQPLAFLVARMRQEVREADAKGLPLKPARVSAAQTRGKPDAARAAGRRAVPERGLV